MAKALLLLLVLSASGLLIWKSCSKCQQNPVPKLELDEWWGPKELKTKQDTSVRPFKVVFSPEMVKDLKGRLSSRRKFTKPLEGVAFQYGFNTDYLESILNYWLNSYDFTRRQEFLNQYPHFKTNIQGLDIHFLRIKPEIVKGTKVLPIVLLHGWPGSFREFFEAIPMLTKPRDGYDFVFELIIPSLPGYGYSDAAVRPGLGSAKIGVIIRNLMQRLGHSTYYVQGGDWGASIGSAISTLFPNEVLGFHTTMMGVSTSCNMVKTVLGSLYPSLLVDESVENRMYPLSKWFFYLLEESGYFHHQATKPDTLGVALTDSPSGLAAYILEKFSTWTSTEHKLLADGGLIKKYSMYSLLDNVMVYWSSQSITTSMRLYAEEMSDANRALGLLSIQTPVPSWALQARYEILYQPPSLLRAKYVNLINTTVLQDGGHFLALEQPATWSGDVFKAVNAFVEWHRASKQKKTEL